MPADTSTGTRISLQNVQVKKVEFSNGRVHVRLDAAVRDMAATIAEVNDMANDAFRGNVTIEAISEQQAMDWNLPPSEDNGKS